MGGRFGDHAAFARCRESRHILFHCIFRVAPVFAACLHWIVAHAINCFLLHRELNYFVGMPCSVLHVTVIVQVFLDISNVVVVLDKALVFGANNV